MNANIICSVQINASTINKVNARRCGWHVMLGRMPHPCTKVDHPTQTLPSRIMSAPKKYKCRYCPQWLPMLKGIQLHVFQQYACQQASIQCTTSKKQHKNESSKSGDPGDNTSQPPSEIPTIEIEEPLIFDQSLPADTQPLAQDSSQPSPSQASWCTHIEEVEDEEVGGFPEWVEDYPGNAGTTKAWGQSYFECWREVQKENRYEPWAPFKDIDKWELSQWIMQSGLTQNTTDKYLKLPIVSLISMQIWKCTYQIHATLFRHGTEQSSHLETNEPSTNVLILFHMAQSGIANHSRS